MASANGRGIPNGGEEHDKRSNRRTTSVWVTFSRCGGPRKNEEKMPSSTKRKGRDQEFQRTRYVSEKKKSILKDQKKKDPSPPGKICRRFEMGRRKGKPCEREGRKGNLLESPNGGSRPASVIKKRERRKRSQGKKKKKKDCDAWKKKKPI